MPFDPVILILKVSSTDIFAKVYKAVCTKTFNVALFIINRKMR